MHLARILDGGYVANLYEGNLPRVLEAGQRRITSLRVQILFMAVVASRAVTGACGSGSVGASR